MTTKFDVDEEVLVPSAQLSNPNDQTHSLTKRKVLSQTERSIVVDDHDGAVVTVASRLVHKNDLRFLIVRVGELRTEPVLDPLAKSVLQFMRLLLPDEMVYQLNIRTVEELAAYWGANHGAVSHVILVGHGTGDSLVFLNENVSAARVVGALLEASPTSSAKTWISLACMSGRTAFAKPFSKSAICREMVAPQRKVHGAAASQFCQNLLSEYLLQGREVVHAYNRAVRYQDAGTFLRWRNGVVHRAPT